MKKNYNDNKDEDYTFSKIAIASFFGILSLFSIIFFAISDYMILPFILFGCLSFIIFYDVDKHNDDNRYP